MNELLKSVNRFIGIEFSSEQELDEYCEKNPHDGLAEYVDGWRDGNEVSRYDALKQNVEQWAKGKGIFDNATLETQLDKTLEEVIETIVAVKMQDDAGLIDGIGDTMVTLIIAAKLANLDLLACLESAYNVIKNRNGKMIDGQFVKDLQ